MKESILNHYSTHYEHRNGKFSTKLLIKFLKGNKIKYLRINCLPGKGFKILSDLVIPIRPISEASISILSEEKINVNELFLFKLTEYYKKNTYGNISDC
jgi:hypothetical protein